MDERQAQIREGAGLDEARLNVEFIEFLKKWSTPLLVIVAVIALGYFGLQRLREARASALSAAFTQLDAARDAGNPVGLLAVAEEHDGQGAVPEIARLQAADIYLGSYRAGMREGAQVTPAGEPEDPATVLSEEERTKQLDKAAELYQKVVAETSGKPDLVQHTIGGMYGLAAVAECRANFDEARRHYDAIETLARTADMPEHVELAKQRLDTLGSLANIPKLYAKAQIPVPPPLLPEGVRQVPNPFGNQTPAPETAAPTATPVEGPVVPPPTPVEPETGAPGAVPPDEKPAEPATEKPAEKPPEKPADPPKDKP
jgi:hypothetical protein